MATETTTPLLGDDVKATIAAQVDKRETLIEMLRRLFTHGNVDPDSAVSAAYTLLYLYSQAVLTFVKAGWDGKGMTDKDIAVDIKAGDHDGAHKGRISDDGTTQHSAIQGLLEDFGTPEEHAAFGNLMSLIEVIDTNPNAIAQFFGLAKSWANHYLIKETSFLGIFLAWKSNQALPNSGGGPNERDYAIVELCKKLLQGFMLMQKPEALQFSIYQLDMMLVEIYIHASGAADEVSMTTKKRVKTTLNDGTELKSKWGKNPRSCFSQLIDAKGSETEKTAFANLGTWLDARTGGKSIVDDVHADLHDSLSLRAIMEAFLNQAEGTLEEKMEVVKEHLEDIMYGMVGNKKRELDVRKYVATQLALPYNQRGSAENQATLLNWLQGKKLDAKIFLFYGGKIAYVDNTDRASSNFVLFEQGVECIIWDDGKNRGIQMCDDRAFGANDDVFKALVERYQEVWFYHISGFLAGNGTRKSQAEFPSRVPIYLIALAVINKFEALKKAAIEAAK